MALSIKKYIMAVILAGALILFMGAALQPAFADDPSGDPAASEVQYDVVLSSEALENGALPGSSYEIRAELRKNNVPEALPEGAVCQWYATTLPIDLDGNGTSDVPEDFAMITQDPSDPMMATLEFDYLPEGFEFITVGVRMEILVGSDVFASSDTRQIDVEDGFYEVIWPEIDPDMLLHEPAEVSVKVVHYSGTAGDMTEKVCEADAYWEGGSLEGENPVMKIVPGERKEDGSYPFTITRLRANADVDDITLKVRYKDYNAQRSFPLYSYSTDLSECAVGLNSGKYFSVYGENMVYVDEEAAKADGQPAVVPAENVFIYLPDGERKQKFDPELFDIKVEKYSGYDKDTYDDIYVPASFPLTFDPAGTKQNGVRTDGTATYFVTLTAKAGSGYTGKTYDQFVGVYSKYSLYNFQENYGGVMEFTALESSKYFQLWDKDPYWRYEVLKGSKVTKGLKPTVKIGDKKLTLGKDFTVVYRNDKTKKTVKSFPTTAGEYTVTITGKAPYYGSDSSIHFKLGKKNPMTVKGKTLTIKAGKKLKKTKKYKVSKVLTKKKSKGKVTYKKLKGNKKITINKKTGKVTVKKGLKKGTYKVKVSVTAAGNAQYFAKTKKVTFKIKVK